MTERNATALLSKVEKRLREAEVDHAWSLYEGAEAQRLARSAGQLAALRYAQECLLEEVALEAFLAELVYLCNLAGGGTRPGTRRGSLPSLLMVDGELVCTYKLTGRQNERRN